MNDTATLEQPATPAADDGWTWAVVENSRDHPRPLRHLRAGEGKVMTTERDAMLALAEVYDRPVDGIAGFDGRLIAKALRAHASPPPSDACDCGATDSGRWRDVHSAECASLRGTAGPTGGRQAARGGGEETEKVSELAPPNPPPSDAMRAKMAAFHDAIAKYPDCMTALHFLWNALADIHNRAALSQANEVKR